jgi:predicted unusual protein kinase regulating ubiquinone biosynthesis (AarF/ABC1/UbiB family)
LDALQSLQDRCPAYPTELAVALFEQELGRGFTEVFELESMQVTETDHYNGGLE